MVVEEATAYRIEHSDDGDTLVVTGSCPPSWRANRVNQVERTRRDRWEAIEGLVRHTQSDGRLRSTLSVVGVRFGGVVTTVAMAAAMAPFGLWMIRDLVRAARNPEPRLRVSADEVRCDFTFLGGAPRFTPSEIEIVKVSASRGVVAVFGRDGLRMPIPWRWVRVDNRELSVLEAAREFCRILGVPGVELFPRKLRNQRAL